MTPARVPPSEEGQEFGRLGQAVMNTIEEASVPVIACIDGYALGGGCVRLQQLVGPGLARELI
jgi:enoyl-CoA hydratase/carnithine racemase